MRLLWARFLWQTRAKMDQVNLPTVLASVVIAALVAGVVALVNAGFERSARRRELIFTKAVELANAKIELMTKAADAAPGRTAYLADHVVYAEQSYWLLTELHDKGRLPPDWRDEIRQKFLGIR